MYVFPGIGLGSIIANVSTVRVALPPLPRFIPSYSLLLPLPQIPEEMIHASAVALAESLNADERSRSLLYPDVERIREVSVEIAAGVIRSAQKMGVDRNEKLRTVSDTKLKEFIHSQMYRPLVEA